MKGEFISVPAHVVETILEVLEDADPVMVEFDSTDPLEMYREAVARYAVTVQAVKHLVKGVVSND